MARNSGHHILREDPDNDRDACGASGRQSDSRSCRFFFVRKLPRSWLVPSSDDSLAKKQCFHRKLSSESIGSESSERIGAESSKKVPSQSSDSVNCGSTDNGIVNRIGLACKKRNSLPRAKKAKCGTKAKCAAAVLSRSLDKSLSALHLEGCASEDSSEDENQSLLPLGKKVHFSKTPSVMFFNSRKSIAECGIFSNKTNKPDVNKSLKMSDTETRTTQAELKNASSPNYENDVEKYRGIISSCDIKKSKTKKYVCRIQSAPGKKIRN